MSMIYLRLAGGLGNQLFQIAAASLAANYLQSQFYICEESLNRYAVVRSPLYRSLLDLSVLPIVDTALVGKVFVYLSAYYRIGKLPGLRIVKVPPRLGFLQHFRFPLFMDGYYQESWETTKLLESVDLIKRAIRPYALETSCPRPGVAIHIRGGDFLGLSDYNVVDYRYYRACVGRAVSQGLLDFGVISDDLSLARQVLDSLAIDYPDATFNLCSGTSPLDDFHLLRTANSRIIGNSTFAWWAFALSPSSGPTWSPGAFLRSRPRAYRLCNEIVVTSI